MNSYILALSETIGRSYGGGVLTFEPGEIRKLRIPLIDSDKLNLIKMDDLMRNVDIEKLLSYADDILLRNGLNLTKEEIETLHNIWLKLRNRRISRKTKRNL